MGKLTSSSPSLSLSAGKEGGSNTEGRDKIEELEQTLFELRGEIGAGRHVPPGVRVLSLSANPAQDWADLR
jgi:mitotic spindle assembly checkpoint protein MAD1